MLARSTQCLRWLRTPVLAASPSGKALSISVNSVEDEDDDLLDISMFGDYNLVLPIDPELEGVSHFVPDTVPMSIPRPLYARPFLDWPTASQRPEASLRRTRLKRKVSPSSLERKIQSMSPAGHTAAHALREAGKGIKVRQHHNTIR